MERNSVLDAEFELEHAWQIRLIGDFAKGRVGDVRVDARKPHIVEDVEAVGAKHKT
jgi:hypothetical protein